MLQLPVQTYRMIGAILTADGPAIASDIPADLEQPIDQLVQRLHTCACDTDLASLEAAASGSAVVFPTQGYRHAFRTLPTASA